jgi:microcystin degradation protein MlrC
MPDLPRIAIAGLGTESSTFSPGRTRTDEFHPRRGDEVFGHYTFLDAGMPLRERAAWLPALIGKAIAGPIVDAGSYAELKHELLGRLAALGELDGLYLDIHGAMYVEGILDAEADLLESIRDTIGHDVLVSASMDLHGNVSPRLVHGIDLVTCYRMAPHEDTMATKQRAVENLLDRLEGGGGRPVKAWVPVPVLLPGEQTSTRMEPAKSLYARVPEVEALDGILDAAIWIGYAWADEPRCHGTVVVTGDDAQLVQQQAEYLATEFWRVRDDFDFVAPHAGFDDALTAALSPGARHPFFISDSGDNPTAGGAGDVTVALARLLERQDELGDLRVVYAAIPDAEATRRAAAVGVGSSISVEAGANIDAEHHGPVLLEGVVTAIRRGDRLAGTEVVVQVGPVSVILTENRKAFHYEHDFTDLGLRPREAGIVVVKIGYLEPELFDMASDWILAITPGGVDQELARLGHTAIRRPMHPFDRFAAEPDLRARLIPRSAEALRIDEA